MTVKAIVLASGGLDSTVAAAVAKEEGWDLYPVSYTHLTLPTILLV